MNIILRPIAFVKNSRKEPIDDHWGDIVSEIVLTDEMPEEALSNIELFSHLEIIYHFNQLPPEHVAYSRKPRGNPAFPSMGILAQRNKDRPNSIGLCTVELLKHQGKSIQVKNLDAIDGTPILDIKPVFMQYQSKGAIRQPEWVNDLMKNYW